MLLLQSLSLVTLAYIVHATSYADLDLMRDLQYIYRLDKFGKSPSEYFPNSIYPSADEDSYPINNMADNGIDKSLPISEYFSESGYPANEANAYPDNNMADDSWVDMYPDVVGDTAPKEARDYGEAALRDQEYMKQLPISGYQFISGGTGRDEEPTEVKTDKVLPAYCTPPNPCPQGYTGSDDCVKVFENSPDNNRRMMAEQDCPCDAEHMLSCPPGKKTIDPKSGLLNTDDLGALQDEMSSLDMDLSDNYSQKRHMLVSKKSPHLIKKREERDYMYSLMHNDEGIEAALNNPYFAGIPKHVAAKKHSNSKFNIK